MQTAVNLSPQPTLSQRTKFARKCFIPCRPPFVLQISSGIIRTVTYLEDGTPVVLGLWGPGDIVGAMLSHINPYYIECFTAVEAIPLAVEDTESLLLFVQSHLKQIEEFTLIRSEKTVEIKLLRLLAWLAQKFVKDQDRQGQFIDLRLTHQDLADIVGTTRVTITRLMAQLEMQGTIERLPLGRIIFHEPDAWFYEI
jgi:CRP-like cAMP-binding protein